MSESPARVESESPGPGLLGREAGPRARALEAGLALALGGLLASQIRTAGWWEVGGLACLLLLTWKLSSRSARGRLAVPGLCLVGAILLAWAGAWVGYRDEADRRAEGVIDRCGAVLAKLGQRAQTLARTAPSPLPPISPAQVSVWLSRDASAPEETAMLVAPDGELTAWFGDGLLHEIREGDLPARGYRVLRSAGGVSVLAAGNIPGSRGWRVVVGRSWRYRDPPPGSTHQSSEGLWRWSLRDAPRPEDLPGLELEAVPGKRKASPTSNGWKAAAALVGGVGIGVLAGRWAFSWWLLGSTPWRPGRPAWIVGTLHGVALALVASGLGASPVLAGSLFLGAALAWWSWAGERSPNWAWRLGGLLVSGLSVGVAFGLGRMAGALPAGAFDELPGGWLTGVTLAFWAQIGPWLSASAAPVSPTLRRATRFLSVAAVLLAIGLDPESGGGVLLLLGLASLLLGCSTDRFRHRGFTEVLLVAGLSLAVLLAAWLRGSDAAVSASARDAARALLPPEPTEIGALASSIPRRLESALLAVPALSELDDTADLAFELWRRSGLDRRDVLSALVVETPDSTSSFTLGLPLRDRRDLDRTQIRWNLLPGRPWRDWLVEREAEGRSRDGQPVRFRFWLLPRPGCCSRGGESPWDLPALLPGDPEGASIPLPPGTSWSLRPRSEEDREDPAVHRAGSHPGSQPGFGSGRKSRMARAENADWRLELAVPTGGWLDRLERLVLTGMLALGALLAWFACGWMAGLPRGVLSKEIGRIWRSYTRRLLALVAFLAFVPVALLYAYLTTALAFRLEGEQRASAAAALSAAQRILGEYVMSLEPGYGIPTAIDDAMLVWLARAVGHDLHLFWGSRLYASSKPELFASGLLARQLPGDVRLALAAGEATPVERRSTLAGITYREVYVGLALPETPPGEEPRLVLAMPLRAQQKTVELEIRRVQARVLVVAAAAFVGLLALGSRMARHFARPIEELVEGTRRIAAGAESLGVRPREVELETVALALDQMAGRLSEGRKQLLVEKEWMERVLETVASPVVVLDGSGRILLANTRARQLLELHPGQEMQEFLREHGEYRPLFPAELLEETGPPTGRITVEIERGDGRRTWSCAWARVSDGRESRRVLVLDEMTELLRVQRLEAWASMARVVAHEVKNPLTPIRLAAQHLREAWSRDPARFPELLDRSVEHILRQVEELRRIVNEFSTFSELPRCDPKPENLLEVVEEAVAPYRDSAPPDLELLVEVPESPVEVRVDRRLLVRALSNLLENSIRACGGRGRIEVVVEWVEGMVAIRVQDRGPGAREEDLPRLLEPYFSTHAGGTGLGLPIALRIAQEHGGNLTVRNRAGGGFEAIVTIPVS